MKWILWVLGQSARLLSPLSSTVSRATLSARIRFGDAMEQGLGVIILLACLALVFAQMRGITLRVEWVR